LRSYTVEFDGRAVYSLGMLDESVADVCSYDPLIPHLSDADPSSSTRAAHAWLFSPGYAALGYLGCFLGGLEERPIVRLNEWLLAATVLLSVMMTRFITSSWTVSLIVGAMLM